MKRFRVFAFLGMVLIILTGCGVDDGGFEFSKLSDFNKTLLKNEEYRFQTRRIGQFKLYFPQGTYKEEELEDLASRLELAKQKAMNVVGITAYERGIQFFIMPSVDAVKAHTKRAQRFLINPEEGLAFVVDNTDERPYFTRALFQLMAFEHWGIPKERIFFDGGAFFADHSCRDYPFPFDDLGAYLAKEEKLPDLRMIVFDFERAYKQDPLAVEVVSAAVFQFVYDNFGRDRTKQLWEHGVREINRYIGMVPVELQNEIYGRFRNSDPPESVDWEYLLKYGC